MRGPARDDAGRSLSAWHHEPADLLRRLTSAPERPTGPVMRTRRQQLALALRLLASVVGAAASAACQPVDAGPASASPSATRAAPAQAARGGSSATRTHRGPPPPPRCPPPPRLPPPRARAPLPPPPRGRARPRRLPRPLIRQPFTSR